MNVNEKMIEAAAASDAKFDGREFVVMSRTDRERYMFRATSALTAALSHADHGGVKVKALEWETKLRRSSEDRQPCTIRPSEADAIISELRQLRRTLDVGQRTSHARKLAFEAALTQAPAPTLTGEVETPAPQPNVVADLLDLWREGSFETTADEAAQAALDQQAVGLDVATIIEAWLAALARTESADV